MIEVLTKGDFNYPAARPEEEWVEYTDALGRTRKCMKKDLKSLQRQDKDIVRDEDDGEQETGEGLRKEEPDLLSADMRMDMLRQKWEQQELGKSKYYFIILIIKF